MQNLISLTVIGLITGLTAGILGAGSEILIVPLMAIFGLYNSFKDRVGTSLFMLLPPVGIWAAIKYYKKGFVDWRGGLYLSLMFTIASGFTSAYNTENIITEQTLQKIFGIFTIACGIYILFHKEK